MPEEEGSRAQLQIENEQLRQRVATLEQEIGKLTAEIARMQRQRQSFPASLSQDHSSSDGVVPYQAIFEHLPIPMVIFRADGQVADINQRNQELLDTSREMLVGKFNMFEDPEARARGYLEHFQRSLAGEVTHMPPTWYDTAKAGSEGRQRDTTIWTQTTYYPIYGYDGTVQYVGEVSLDVTKQLQAEQVRTNEELLRTLFQSIPVMITAANEEGQIIAWNNECERVTGYSADEIVHNPRALELLYPNRAYREWMLTKLQQSHFHFHSMELEVTCKDDSVKTIAWMSGSEEYPIPGWPRWAVAMDVTEQRRSEEALRNNQALLQDIIDHSPSVIYVKNLEGQFLLVNHFVSAALKLPIDQIVGKSEYDLFSSALVETWRESDQQVIATGQPVEHEELFELDGVPHAQILTKFPLYNHQGTMYALGGIGTDITERKQADERVRRQLKHLSALRQIDMAISASMDLRLTLGVLLGHVVNELHVPAATVMLLSPQTQILEHIASRGFFSPLIQHINLHLNSSYAGHVVLERRPITVENLLDDSTRCARANLLREEQLSAYYGLPLIVKGQVMGVLELFHRHPFLPDQEWLNFLEAMAGQAAIAIDNAHLFERLQRTNDELALAYDATIEGWAQALEMRDAETEGHTRRVTEMAGKLAEKMGFSSDELIHIRRGAILHDVGKMAIPDSILLKQGPLSDDEWHIMRQHTVYAYHMLSAIPFLRPALDIPYYHHEKWDGTGYPVGLQREDIPLSARLFAVIDVWDALIFDRPYRKAWPREKVHHYVYEQRGKHFDPRVVDIFLDMVEPLV